MTRRADHLSIYTRRMTKSSTRLDNAFSSFNNNLIKKWIFLCAKDFVNVNLTTMWRHNFFKPTVYPKKKNIFHIFFLILLFLFQVWNAQWTARAGTRHARYVLHPPIRRVLPEKVSPTKSQLSGHVSAERDLLLDDSRENRAHLQACHDLSESGEFAQSSG